MNTYDILGIPQPVSGSSIRFTRMVDGKHGKRRNKSRNGMRGGNDKQDESISITTDEQTESSTDKHEHVQRDMTEQSLTNDLTVEKYEPKITRPTMSIFEYAEAHTKFAEFLSSEKSIRNYVDDVEIKGNVNPTELAFHLLKDGKWDATIDRGYELVSYSKLKINPQWEQMLQHYFDQQHTIQENDLFKPLGLGNGSNDKQ